MDLRIRMSLQESVTRYSTFVIGDGVLSVRVSEPSARGRHEGEKPSITVDVSKGGLTSGWAASWADAPRWVTDHRLPSLIAVWFAEMGDMPEKDDFSWEHVTFMYKRNLLADREVE